jgi:hypothetical protein
MKKNCFVALLFVLLTLWVKAQPSITSFTPASGMIGQTVTISGSNFSAAAANNSVFFGGIKATVSVASASSLIVTVPVGAGFRYISVTNLSTNLTAYSAMPFEVTFPCGSGITSASFSSKVDFTPGSHPVSTTAADINGDGRLDLLVANAYANSVSVMVNTSTPGTISFAAAVDFTVGSNPWAVTTGDLDGDGMLDIATANGLSDNVSVLRNTSTLSTVSFAAKTDYAAGVQPYAVAIHDLNGDGKPELVAGYNSSPGAASVYKNTSTAGTISLNAKMDFATGDNPKSVGIADIDGDGKPDLVLAAYNTSANAISILRNTTSSGSIAFAAKVDLPAGTNPYGIALGDLDGDGKTDIASPNSNANTLSVYRNTSSSGSVSFATKVDYTTGSNPVSIAIDDLNGDGKPDIALSNQFSNTVSVFANNSASGTMNFAAKVDFITATVPYSMTIADFDGDQRPDMASADASANLVSTFKSQMCPVGISDPESLSLSAGVYPNPFSSSATLEINDFKNGAYELHICDLVGKIVYSSVIATAISEVDRGNLPAGIYFLQLVSKDGKATNKKIVIE